MNDHDEDIDARLARIAAATRDIQPRADFGARVTQALEPEPRTTWLLDVWSAGRRFVPVAALAATVAVIWAVNTDSAIDDDLALSYDATDVEW